jgi:hypothetical protein
MTPIAKLDRTLIVRPNMHRIAQRVVRTLFATGGHCYHLVGLQPG